MVYAAIALLVIVVAGLVLVLYLDRHRLPGGHWIDVLKDWQNLLGAVLGFVSAAGVLILGTALSQMQEQQRTFAAQQSIGLALAYESERMATSLELGRRLGEQIDPNNVDLKERCKGIASAMRESMQRQTPVFDAGIQRMVDFGEENLSKFVRFHAFYTDFLQSVDYMSDATCDEAGATQAIYMLNQVQIGLRFYQAIADSYGVTPFGPSDKVQALIDLANAPYEPPSSSDTPAGTRAPANP